MRKLRPMQGRVLVAVDPPPTHLGGIELPENVRSEYRFSWATVVAVGDLQKVKDHNMTAPLLKNDRVLIDLDAPMEITFDGQKLRLLSFGDIKALKVPDLVEGEGVEDLIPVGKRVFLEPCPEPVSTTIVVPERRFHPFVRGRILKTCAEFFAGEVVYFDDRVSVEIRTLGRKPFWTVHSDHVQAVLQ